jgi:hypothetical protein
MILECPPGPARVDTRNGSRARVPTPNVVWPSKLPANFTERSVVNPVRQPYFVILAGGSL